MLRPTDHLKGMTLGATDGEIGTVKDVYFSDQDWTLRYFVIDTGGWLTGRKVLITPLSIRDVRWDLARIDVRLTRQQVENSPSIDTDKPVSRQQEASFYDYYGYPYYWMGPHLGGPVPLPNTAASSGTEPAARHPQERETEDFDAHLRSINAVVGYHIEATDGAIGHVEDFLYDDQTWTIRFLAVDTRNWLPGKHVLVAADAVGSVSWGDRAARLKLTLDAVRESPEYDGSGRLDAETEARLVHHFAVRSQDPQQRGIHSR